MRQLNKNFSKIDAKAIITGQKIYTDDLADEHALIIKLKKADIVFGEIEKIDVTRAKKVKGIVEIYTYEDVPQNLFTLAGQTYPEMSAYDTLILSKRIHYHKEPVAIVVGENESSVNEAIKKIKISYKEYPFTTDAKNAMNTENPIHTDYHFLPDKKIIRHDLNHNIAGAIDVNFGEDFEKVYNQSEVHIESSYEIKAQAHAMMETYRSYAYIDYHGRLVVITSTQVPFHIKRQLADALEISPSKIRIIKPRIGGGFGGKQTSVTEIYAGFVTWKLKRPSKIVFDRKETFENSNTRHQMNLEVKLSGSRDGIIDAICLKALSNQGAYGYHAYTTLSLVGDKSLPLYPHIKSGKFSAKVVHTNTVTAGAFRGYGAVQGIFAVESAVNEYAKKIGMDPCDVRLLNTVEEGDIPTCYNQKVLSCTLKDCIKRGKEMIDWDSIYPFKINEDKTIDAVGMAIAQQGSGIAIIDNANCEIRLNPEGDFTLLISPTDNGQGVDTIMTRMAAEVLDCEIDSIITVVSDTDITPFDPGSYASSGVYTTGSSVVKACKNLIEEIFDYVQQEFKAERKLLSLRDNVIYVKEKKLTTTKEIAQKLTKTTNGRCICAKASFASETSPAPYMAGFCHINLNVETGKIYIKNYAAAVDCGTVMSRNLACVQVEGGITQSIGYALYEDQNYSKKGKLIEHSFLNYNIPRRGDIGNILVDFCESYEPTGPFGAKSIGELVSDTPVAAIANALLNATGIAFRNPPFTPYKVWKILQKHNFKVDSVL